MGEDKIFVIILALLLKNETKDTFYKYTQYSNKINSVLFSGTIGVFISSIQETELINITLYRCIPIKAGI